MNPTRAENTDRDPTVLPDWLHQALTPTPSAGLSAPAVAAATNSDSYVAAAVRGEAHRVRTAPLGQHNAVLCRAAYALGQLVGAGLLDELTARAELTTAAQVLIGADCDCTPGEVARDHRQPDRWGPQSPPLPPAGHGGFRGGGMNNTHATRDHDSDSPAMVRFYLGTHQPHWLWRTSVPLFISRRALQRRTLSGLRPALGRWALDSGGFTELSLHGRWTLPAETYAELVAAYADRITGLDFAAPQDWMCEPTMLTRTGLTVREHQERTVTNYLHLRTLAPELPFIPVLQGWTPTEYLTCLELYAQAGVDLATQPLVGLGSICRRQATGVITALVTDLSAHGLRLHGFGVKTTGLHHYAHHLASADSLAWSLRARHSPPLPNCTGHTNCANCLPYALTWRHQLLTNLATTPPQRTLFEQETAA